LPTPQRTYASSTEAQKRAKLVPGAFSQNKASAGTPQPEVIKVGRKPLFGSSTPSPAQQPEPAAQPKMKTAAGGKIVEQPRSPEIVAFQNRITSIHTVAAFLQLIRELGTWLQLAFTTSQPSGAAPLNRMDAYLMMRWAEMMFGVRRFLSD
jgi:hypothetical protein